MALNLKGFLDWLDGFLPSFNIPEDYADRSFNVSRGFIMKILAGLRDSFFEYFNILRKTAVQVLSDACKSFFKGLLVPTLCAWFVRFFNVARAWIILAASNVRKELYNLSIGWLLRYAQADDTLFHSRWALFISLSISIGPWILLLLLFILLLLFFILLFLINAVLFVVLYVLGFRPSGIMRGSLAARFQSFFYGGRIPLGSLFSKLQSAGASYNKWTTRSWVLSCIRLAAGAVAIYILLRVVIL